MSLLEQFAAGRPNLPHPLERHATEEFMWRSRLVDCDECHAPLTSREYDPDGSYEGEDEGGSHYSCSNGACVDCREPEDDEP